MEYTKRHPKTDLTKSHARRESPPWPNLFEKSTPRLFDFSWSHCSLRRQSGKRRSSLRKRISIARAFRSRPIAIGPSMWIGGHGRGALGIIKNDSSCQTFRPRGMFESRRTRRGDFSTRDSDHSWDCRRFVLPARPDRLPCLKALGITVRLSISKGRRLATLLDRRFHAGNRQFRSLWGNLPPKRIRKNESIRGKSEIREPKGIPQSKECSGQTSNQARTSPNQEITASIIASSPASEKT